MLRSTSEAGQDHQFRIGGNGQRALSAGDGDLGILDGGKIMKYTAAPVLGGDGKTALAHNNVFDPLTSVFLQGKSTEPTVYHDDTRSIQLDAGRNAYFKDKMQTSGQL